MEACLKEGFERDLQIFKERRHKRRHVQNKKMTICVGGRQTLKRSSCTDIIRDEDTAELKKTILTQNKNKLKHQREEPNKKTQI